jgi:hypothetical protein
MADAEQEPLCGTSAMAHRATGLAKFRARKKPDREGRAFYFEQR